ncbi:MAG: hypothetical protein V1767_00760 [Chloroflexota bacterium]
MSEKLMTIQEKAEFMMAFKPGELLAKLTSAEKEYRELLTAQSKFRMDNASYVKGARGGNSEAVEDIEVQLVAPAEIDGKKATDASKKTWLDRQKIDNKELAAAYNQQKVTEITTSDYEIRIKVCEVTMTNIRSMLALRTSQFAFFAGALRIEVAEPEINNEEEKA